MDQDVSGRSTANGPPSLPVAELALLGGAAATGWLATLTPLGAAGAGTLLLALVLVERRRRQRAQASALAAQLADARASEQRCRDFADVTGDFFWETDEDLRFSWFSPRPAHVTGVDPQSMIGLRREEGADMSLAPEAWKSHLQTLSAREPFEGFEYERLDSDGERRILRVNGTPTWHADGRFAGYRGSGRDVTSERLQRQRANRAEDRFREAISHVPEGVALFDADDVLVACNAAYASHFVVDADPASCVGRTFEALFRTTLTGNYRQRDDQLETTLGHRLAVHREAAGKPVNIELDDGRSVVLRDYRTADGGCLVLVTDVTEIIASRQALRTSDERLQDFSEVAADWFWETDAELRFTFISERFETLTGFRRAGFLGRTRQEATGTNLPSGSLQRIDELCLARQPFRDLVYDRIQPDGTTRHFRVSGVPVHDRDGRFVGYRGSGMDVTESTEATNRLRAAETRLVAALEGSADGVAVFDADDRLVLCNAVYRRTFFGDDVTVESGTTFEALVRDNLERGLLATPNRDEPWVQHRLAQHARADGTPVDVWRTDGRWTQVRDFRTAEGGTLVVITDITDQKAREAALERSEQRLRDYAETAADWFWETGVDLGLTYLSDRFAALTGSNVDDLLGERVTRLGMRVTTTGTNTTDAPRALLRALRKRQPFRDVPVRFDAGNGMTRYLRVSGRPGHDANGGFTGYRGTGTDITAEVEAAQRSAALEARLTTAIRAIRDGFALFDADDRLVVCNDTWRNYSDGTAAIKTPGTPFETIVRAEVEAGLVSVAPGEEEDYVRRRLAAHRSPGTPSERRYSSGRWLRINEYRTDDGEYVLIATDVTALKEREAELVESEQRFRAFAEASGDWFWEMDTDGRFTAVTGGDRSDRRGPEFKAGQTLTAIASEDTDTARWHALGAALDAGHPLEEFMFELAAEDGQPLELALSGSAVFGPDGRPNGYRGVARDVTVRRGVERLLRELAATPARTGLQQLMDSSVEGLASVFGVDLAFIAMFPEDSADRADTRAVWARGAQGEPFSYSLDGSPCSQVRDRDGVMLVPSGVAAAFPRDQMLSDEGLEGYFGTCLSLSDGTPIGLLVLAHSEPLQPSALLAPLPEVVAARIAAELERERAERQLAESERTLRSLFEHAPVVLELKDGYGRYQRVSPPFETTYGVAPESILGRPPSAVLPEAVSAAVEAADRAVLATGIARTTEEVVDAAGTTRTLLVQRFPILDADARVLGVGSAATDISAQKHAESRARSAYDLLLAAIENVNEGFVLFDADDRLVLTNSRNRALYPELDGLLQPGTTRSALQARFLDANPGALASPAAREHFMVGQPIDGPAPPREIRLTDGRWLELRSSRTPDGWTIVLSIDITAHKLAERNLALLRDELELRVADRTRALEDAQAELVKSERLATIGRLAATVSHELRNPLGALRNAAFLLRRRIGEGDEKSVQYLDIVDREVGNSSRIIDDLLETTRTKPPHHTTVEIEAVVRETLASLSLPDTMSVSCTAQAGPMQISVDPLQFRQVLSNLITNAAQAMNHRGAVSIDASNGDDRTVITVADDGPGIAEEFRERVFEPLFTTRSKGNGLGLWISREIVRRHGGELNLCDASGRGACFAMTIPLEPPDSRQEAAE